MRDREFSRRALLQHGVALGGAVALGSAPVATAAKRPRRVRREALLRDGSFRHGVASGLPGEREITLWTRVSELERSGDVVLEVARDDDFRRIVQRRAVRATSVRDFTARATVSDGLEPGEEYFYRFATAGKSSDVGRFRTARPADSREPVRIGFFSCQDYQAGYYTALAGLADEPDLDLVVCLGDYIYERTFYSGPAERKDPTGANGDADVQTLPEYRDKYALYRTDEQLQRLHAAHPFVAVWDDHEIEDNWAGEEPGEATGGEGNPERRVPFSERRRQAFLAFFEWMPRFRLREDPSRIYGSVPLGANAELFLLDTRQYRDDQPCGDQFLVPCPDGELTSRTLLGDAQKRWLKKALTESRATWKLVGNQVMIMGMELAPGPTGINPDAWDGYGRERTELLEHLLATGTQDVSFLTGDIHTFFAGDVTTTGDILGRPAATEFVGGSITSLGFEDVFGPGTAVTEPGILLNNPHLRYSQQTSRGYGVVEARPDELRVAFRGPRTTMTPDSDMRTLGQFRVAKGSPHVEVVRSGPGARVQPAR